MRPLQSLTFEALIDTVSTTFGAIPDPRRPDRVDYSLHDTLLSGFAMMVFQHPVFWVLIRYHFDYESVQIWRSEALEMSRYDPSVRRPCQEFGGTT